MPAVLPRTGPEGPVGPQGPIGPQGPKGDTPAPYVHDQISPAATWTVDHNLNCRPVVVVVDSTGAVVEGDVRYPSLNRTVLSFSGAFAGVATFTP